MQNESECIRCCMLQRHEEALLRSAMTESKYFWLAVAIELGLAWASAWASASASASALALALAWLGLARCLLVNAAIDEQMTVTKCQCSVPPSSRQQRGNQSKTILERIPPFGWITDASLRHAICMQPRQLTCWEAERPANRTDCSASCPPR